MGHKVICPYCGQEIEVYGNGFYGTYECPVCSTEQEEHWFNAFGQEVIPPYEQVKCDDW